MSTEDPPSPVEDDLGVDDFDLKQDHLLGPSPPPPPQHHHHSDLSSSLVDAYVPDNVTLEDSHDHHILQDDHHDDDDDDQDVVAMLDEERDDKTAAVKAEDDDNDNDNNASDENESPMLTAVSSPLLASPQQQPRLQQEPQSVASVASASSVTATPSPKRKKRERNNLRKAPQAPKRFKSSYICFFTSKQSEIKERLGSTATVSQVSKESAQMWKKLTPDEKAYWDDVAAKDKERYMEEKANYTGPWQVANKRQKKDKSAPKRPMSAFLYFSQGRRKEIKEKHPYFKNTEISRVLGEMWRNSSEEERGPFIELEKVERVKYKQAMAQWKVEFAKKKEVERLEQVEQMKQKQEAMQMQGEQIRAHQHAMQVAAHQQYDGAVARAAAVAAADADAADQAKHGMQRHHQQQHQQAYHPMHHYPYMPPHHAAYAQFIPPGYPSMYHHAVYSHTAAGYPYGATASPGKHNSMAYGMPPHYGMHQQQHQHPLPPMAVESMYHQRHNAYLQSQPPSTLSSPASAAAVTSPGTAFSTTGLAAASTVGTPNRFHESSTPIPLASDDPPSIPSPDM